MRPSPLRKRVMSPEKLAAAAAAAPASSAANSTQYSISPYKNSDVENDEGSARKKHKREARWARREVLMPYLQTQQLHEADNVFGGPVGLTCNLHDVFDGYRPHKKKHAVRGSSASWSDMGGPVGAYKK